MAAVYSGVWRSGSEPYYLWVNADQQSFIAKWQELNGLNLRLVDLKTSVIGSHALWSGVWRGGSDGHYLWINASQDNFIAKWRELAPSNLRLTTLNTYEVNGQRLWAGVWRAGSDGYYLWINADQSNFIAKWQELNAQNLRLVDLDVQVLSGQVLWNGVWRSGSDGHYLWINASQENFIAKWRELSAQGLRLTTFKTYVVNGVRLWAGVWRAGSDPYYLWVNASFDNFVAKWQELAAQNLRLINLESWSVGLIPTVQLHLKVLTQPTIAINTMVTRMRDLYESVGINVHLASIENLNLPALNDVDVGPCNMGQTPTAEQTQLFGNRNNAGANDVVVYFVRSTVPGSNGCAAHPAGQPGAVVAQGATQWTLAHEVGHVLGLGHVTDNDRLMTGNGTGNITNPPPDLIATETQTMVGSAFTIDS